MIDIIILVLVVYICYASANIKSLEGFNEKAKVRCPVDRCFNDKGEIVGCKPDGIMPGTLRHEVGRYCMDPASYNELDGTKGMTPLPQEYHKPNKYFETYFRPKKPKYNMKCTTMDFLNDDLWFIKEPEGYGIKNRWIWKANNKLCYYT